MKTTINKKITSAIISISLLFSLTTPVHASPVLSEDEFLLSIGVPQSVIEQMPEKQKELIYTTADKNARYESYKKEEFIEENQQNSNLQPRLTELPAAEMTISVISFKEERDTGTYYAIYPSFVWHGLSKIQNDSFGMALYPNWEVIPQQNNLEVWNRNSNGDLLHHTSISATDANSAGYAYQIPSTVGSLQGYYEGHAYLHAIKKSDDATHAISLKYVDDTSWLSNISYGLSIGFMSISVSNGDDRLRVRAANHYF